MHLIACQQVDCVEGQLKHLQPPTPPSLAPATAVSLAWPLLQPSSYRRWRTPALSILRLLLVFLPAAPLASSARHGLAAARLPRLSNTARLFSGVHTLRAPPSSHPAALRTSAWLVPALCLQASCTGPPSAPDWPPPPHHPGWLACRVSHRPAARHRHWLAPAAAGAHAAARRQGGAAHVPPARHAVPGGGAPPAWLPPANWGAAASAWVAHNWAGLGRRPRLRAQAARVLPLHTQPFAPFATLPKRARLSAKAALPPVCSCSAALAWRGP